MEFGELVEPVSRAFYDSYDDPAENNEYVDPEWISPVLLRDISQVVILEGDGVEEFAHLAVLQGQTAICKTVDGSCSVYDLPETNTVIVTVQEKNLNKYSLLTELLEPIISGATEIATLTIQSTASHKKEQNDTDDPVCYLRSLNCPIEYNYIMPLEAPNLITGVAAGVSTWRAFKKLGPVHNFIAFMEAPQFDSYSTKPLIGLLRRLSIPCVTEFKGRFKNESNLYM